MRISHVHIENFRNFKICDVDLGQNIILVGENKSGKTNFIEALRLVLDPSLSEADRQLVAHDFWDGDGEPPFSGREIKISIQFSDFADASKPEPLPLSWLGRCLIQTAPKYVAQITYWYHPDKEAGAKPSELGPDDYIVTFFSKNDPNEVFVDIKGLQRDMPLNFMEALRDIASDNKVWHRSPLNRLIKLTDLSMSQIEPYAETIKTTSDKIVAEIEPLSELQTEIQTRLNTMIGELYKIDPRLGLNATTPEALLGSLRLFADGSQQRSLERISLGLQNVLYLTLLSLLLKRQKIKRNKKKQPFNPIIALEEPEAHLHPHLQRLVFKDFLSEASNLKQPVIISTHSPHLASSADIRDLVLLRDYGNIGCKAESAYGFLDALDERFRKDLERFLDVTKSEMLFAKGVIFVEGDVEVLLVNEFAQILGISLDKYGISICNVYGVNFTHVVTLAHHFRIPFVVLTDGDKFNPVTGLQRGLDLFETIRPTLNSRLKKLHDAGKKELVRMKLRSLGVFVNDWTLEPTLLDSGLHEELKQTFAELGDELGEKVRAGTKHIDSYLTDNSVENMEKILGAIADSRWGKGRFAQRLAGHIRKKSATLGTQEEKNKIVPEYIRSSIRYLLSRIS